MEQRLEVCDPLLELADRDLRLCVVLGVLPVLRLALLSVLGRRGIDPTRLLVLVRLLLLLRRCERSAWYRGPRAYPASCEE